MSTRRRRIRSTLLLAPALLVLAACADGGSAPRTEPGTEPGAEERLTSVAEEGPVRATVELAPAEPRLGDPLQLTLTVEAEPQVTVEMPAFGEALGRFSIVDFTPRAETDDEGRSVQSQRYTLQAPMSGKQRIPPLRIEFLDQRDDAATQAGEIEYRELLTDELAVTVASVLPEGAVTDELRPLRGELRERPAKRWRWLTALAALGIVGAMVGLSLYLRRLSVERARVTAYDKAMKRIAALERRGLPAPGDADAWYVELSHIVRHYLEDRYGLRAPELTTEEFLQEAGRSRELSDAHRQLLSTFLERCDRVKFAAYHPEQAESRQALELSRRFLQETRLLPDQEAKDRRAAA
jgi:hypothetical protein